MRLGDLIKTWRLTAGTIFAEWWGGLLVGAAVQGQLVAITYGVAPILDASLGNDFTLTITDGVAFVFGVPLNPPPTGFAQTINITYRNTSGGAHGAGTFNAVFKTSGALAAVATAFSRTISFRWNGTNWVEFYRSAADVAN